MTVFPTKCPAPGFASITLFALLSIAPSFGVGGPQSNATATPCASITNRPCIALVLAGGGARGSAHIGVLKAIEERGIPVDLAVGTSIGSFISGLYATGKSASDIEHLFLSADWKSGYRDDLPRSRIPNRRKRHNDRFPIQLGIGLDGEGFKLPKGVIQGQGMKRLIDVLLGSYPEQKNFDDLPIPYRAVASDLETGAEVVLDKGDLATSMQASMSLPGVLRPIEIDNRILVDGGIANNLPVSVAKNLGADIVIAVDIGTPPKQRNEISSSLDILDQLSNFLTQGNQNLARAMISDRDILIRPELSAITLVDFELASQGIQAGYAAAISAFSSHPELPKYSMATKKDAAQMDLEIADVEFVNHSRLGVDYIAHRMQLDGQAPFTQDQIQDGIERLYGQGTIARARAVDTLVNDQRTSVVSVEEKEWGPGYLDFKFDFEDNFSSYSRFEIGAAWRYTNLTPYGAEWTNSVEFGTEKSAKTQIYWPLRASGFFLSGDFEVRREISTYTIDGQSLGEHISTAHTTGSGLGYEFGDAFDVLVGLTTEQGTVNIPDILIPQLGRSEIDYDQSALFIRADFDTLDEADFARSGWKFISTIQRNKTNALGIKEYSDQYEAELTFAYSHGHHTIKPTIKGGNIFNETPVSFSNFELGGFLNLSGNDRDFISGPFMRFARIVYTYQLARNLIGGTELPFYFGLSYEAGNVWEERSAISWNSAIQSGSVFLGWDSPVGPAFLSYGQSESSNESVYISLGKRF